MAEEDLDLDVQQPAGKKLTKWVIIALIVVVMIVASSVAAWLLMADKDSNSDEETTEKKPPVERPTAIYHPLKPTFIVNFADASQVAYLQTDIEIMAYDQDVIAAVQEHMPIIRNNVLLILGSQTYESINTIAGKEKLRQEVLEGINKILRAKAGKHETKKSDQKKSSDKKGNKIKLKVNKLVQEVYFTSFIMQ